MKKSRRSQRGSLRRRRPATRDRRAVGAPGRLGQAEDAAQVAFSHVFTASSLLVPALLNFPTLFVLVPDFAYLSCLK